jgi:hypothetical protein
LSGGEFYRFFENFKEKGQKNQAKSKKEVPNIANDFSEISIDTSPSSSANS